MEAEEDATDADATTFCTLLHLSESKPKESALPFAP
jgi:hypothetical protein